MPARRASLGWSLADLIESDLGITLTEEQGERLVELYALDPESGRRLVRRAALRRPKGAGKSPEGGFVAYAELVGPVEFSHWDRRGNPVGKPRAEPWVQLAAVSEDQTDNVMVWLYDVLADREATRARHGIDLGRSRVLLVERPGRIEPVTAAAGSREGQRITFAVLDQTESWTRENGGRRLADVLRRNAAKMSGWTLELQNAPEPGDGSVADETARASEKRSAGVLFDDRPGPDVPELADTKALREALLHAYGEAAHDRGGWVDLDRLVEEIQDPATDPADARRYYLNQATPMARRAFDRAAWAECATGEPVPAGELVVAGFDGSLFDDATALVAVSVESARVWLAASWVRPDDADDDWQVPTVEVDQAVADLFDTWDVWRLYGDPAKGWDVSLARWAAAHRRKRTERVMEWWTHRHRAVGVACRNLAAAVRSRQLAHTDGSTLTQHVHNAVRRRVPATDDEGRPLWTLAKESPGRKIDAAMALVLAWEARTDALAAGAKPSKRSGGSWSF